MTPSAETGLIAYSQLYPDSSIAGIMGGFSARVQTSEHGMELQQPRALEHQHIEVA